MTGPVAEVKNANDEFETKKGSENETDPSDRSRRKCWQIRSEDCEGLTAADVEKCVWLKPKLVAAIEYAEWTPANHLRHSRFVALREDKDSRQVVRE